MEKVKTTIRSNLDIGKQKSIFYTVSEYDEWGNDKLTYCINIFDCLDQFDLSQEIKQKVVKRLIEDKILDENLNIHKECTKFDLFKVVTESFLSDNGENVNKTETLATIKGMQYIKEILDDINL